MRIANHAALRAAERNIHDRALPCHPTGEGAYFVQRDVRCIADTAFGRTARNRMLYAEASEDLEMPVIHLHRNVDREFAVGITQHPPQAVIQIELLRSQIETR